MAGKKLCSHRSLNESEYNEVESGMYFSTHRLWIFGVYAGIPICPMYHVNSLFLNATEYFLPWNTRCIPYIILKVSSEPWYYSIMITYLRWTWFCSLDRWLFNWLFDSEWISIWQLPIIVSVRLLLITKFKRLNSVAFVTFLFIVPK